MINVMIVDDEYLIRQLLINSIDWCDLGFQIVSEAEDGQEALDAINQYNPDLIIVDINIPIINGIELTRIISDRYPHIKMIIFTGYEEFDYAKKAIQNGVCEYFVKPLEPECFTLVLKKIKSNIESQRKISIKLNHFDKHLLTNQRLVKEQFLIKLLHHEHNSTFVDIPTKIKEYGIDQLLRHYYVATVHINYLQKYCANNSETKLWQTTITNVIKEMLIPHCKIVTFIDRLDNIILIIDDSITVSDLKQLFHQVYTWILKYLDFTITVGISDICHSYTAVHQTYQHSIEAYNQFYWDTTHCVSSYVEGSSVEQRLLFNKRKLYESTLRLMRANEVDDLTAILNSFFDSLKTSKAPKTQIQLLVIDLIELLRDYSIELNIKDIECLNSTHSHFEIIQSFETIDDINTWLVQLFKQTFNDIRVSLNSKSYTLALEAQAYIEEHFTDPLLSLDEIACALFVSPSHLSKVYKKELNINISQEITNYRLEKAKKILDTDNKILKLLKLAECVGYSDVYYFSRCFKKKYGLSPRKYVETKRKKLKHG